MASKDAPLSQKVSNPLNNEDDGDEEPVPPSGSAADGGAAMALTVTHISAATASLTWARP